MNTWSCLADPKVLAAVSPDPGEVFDPVEFLEKNGTVYLFGTAGEASSTARLVAAFIEDLVDVASRLAAVSPNSRLDPPLALILDEAANYPIRSATRSHEPGRRDWDHDHGGVAVVGAGP